MAQMSTTKTAIYLLRFNVALQIAILAIVINLLLAIFTFLNGLNSLYCAFGIDCVIGVITSSILVWRFASNRSETLANPQDEQVYLLNSYKEGYGYSKSDIVCRSVDYFDSSIESDNPSDQQRELWSTFWLGQVMIISGIGVIVRTLLELIAHSSSIHQHGMILEEHSNDLMKPLFDLAIISLALNLLLMVFKILVYIYLRSNSMLVEGVNSFISALFAAVACISIEYSQAALYLDQIVSIVFGIFLLIYGAYNFLHTISKTLALLIKNERSGYQRLV